VQPVRTTSHRVTMLLVAAMLLPAWALAPLTAPVPVVAATAAGCERRFLSQRPPGECPPPRTGASAAGLTQPNFQDSVVFGNLIQPTAVRFAADGRVFVAEKRGVIKVFDNLEDTTPTIFADLSTNVYDYADSGLLGLALDPNFPATPYVYVLYGYDAAIGATAPRWNDDCPDAVGVGCLVSGRLSRLQAAGDVMTGVEQVLINDWCKQYTSHTIGDLAFGPDGSLYVSGGDGASFIETDYGQLDGNPCGDPANEGGALRSQDLRTTGDALSLDGKIIRIRPATLAALPGNPLVANSAANAQLIIAHGLRNPFRFTFRPVTNELWLGDVGWGEFEELNRIPDVADGIVKNFGWPCYEGNGHQGSYDDANLPICENLYGQAGAVTPPFFSYRHNEPTLPNEDCQEIYGGSSISGVAFYNGGAYPARYDGALFHADYSRTCIWVMFPGADGVPDPANRATFATGVGAVGLTIGPGGDLFYVDIFGGAIHRITYLAPIAVAQATTPRFGPVPLTVRFDGSGSRDQVGSPLTFAWDLDGDGEFDDAGGPTPSFTYTQLGRYDVRLKVTNASGVSSISAPIVITPGNDPPTARIDGPSASTARKVGDTIAFSGSGTDGPNPLPDANLAWTIVLYHCDRVSTGCHAHPLQTFTGGTGSFTAPDHAYPAYLEVRLTATDATGLQDTKTVRLDPQTVPLTFAANHAGLRLTVGESKPEVAPFTRTVIVGSNTSVAASSPQTVGGVTFEFVRWSDGGGPSRSIRAGATPATYTAEWRTVPGGGTTLTLPATPGGRVTVEASDGRLTAAPASLAYPAGTPVTLVATPEPGYLFTGWRLDGAPQGWANPLSLTLSGERTVVATFAPRPAFSDLPADHPAAEAIGQLAARGIIKGYGDGTFGTGDIVLRAQMAALLVRAMDWSGEAADTPFGDRGEVDDELWNAVGVLAARGVARGYGDGSFGPLDPVLHAQAISFITRALVAQGAWTTATVDDPSPYANVPLTSGHRLDLLTYLGSAGAVYDRSPGASWADWDTPGSRGWFALILWQALDAYYSVDRVP